MDLFKRKTQAAQVEEVKVLAIEEKPKSLADIFSGLKMNGGVSPVDGIMELTHADSELPLKSVVLNPSGFTACQVLAVYNDSLGFTEVADLLREVCNWQYQHNSAKDGKRAEQAFAALSGAVQQQEQLLIAKETKGLLRK